MFDKIFFGPTLLGLKVFGHGVFLINNFLAKTITTTTTTTLMGFDTIEINLVKIKSVNLLFIIY